MLILTFKTSVMVHTVSRKPRGGMGSIPGQSTWHWDRFSSECCFSTCEYRSSNAICMSLLPKGQTGNAWKPSKKQGYLEYGGGGYCIQTYVHFFRLWTVSEMVANRETELFLATHIEIRTEQEANKSEKSRVTVSNLSIRKWVLYPLFW